MNPFTCRTRAARGCAPPSGPMLLACHSAPPPGSSGRGDDGGKRGGPSALFPPIVAPRAPAFAEPLRQACKTRGGANRHE